MSKAHLSAAQVMEASTALLFDIKVARQSLLHELAQPHRKRPWYLPDRSLATAIGQLTKPELEIMEQHRLPEEKTVRSLLDLASAAAADDPDFRVDVAAGDFQLIKRHYNPRSR